MQFVKCTAIPVSSVVCCFIPLNLAEKLKMREKLKCPALELVSYHCRKFCFCSSAVFTTTDPSLITICVWQFCRVMFVIFPWFYATYVLLQKNRLNSDTKEWI